MKYTEEIDGEILELTDSEICDGRITERVITKKEINEWLGN